MPGELREFIRERLQRGNFRGQGRGFRGQGLFRDDGHAFRGRGRGLRGDGQASRGQRAELFIRRIMAAVDTRDFETILAEATQRGSDITPGVVLAAVDKNGKDIYKKTAGYQSMLPDASPIQEDGIMWIASCTKLITSVCALRCVERGQVTLDEPLGKHLPELASPQVVALDESAPGGFTLRPANKPITLRMLLTHTSGIAYEWGDPRLAAWRKAQPEVPLEQKGLMHVIYNIPLLFDPGEGWVYGGSLDWAGILVARLNDTTLEKYFEDNVFGPLGMKSTTFHLSERPDLKERLVSAGKRTADGGLVPYDGFIFPAFAQDQSGGGGLWSCSGDYMKVLADLIKDDPILLKRETVVNMLAKPQITEDSALAGLVAGRSAVTANASPAAAGLNYGLGGMVMTKWSPLAPEGTLAWGGLPNLKWFLHPELQIAALYATQVMPAGDVKNTVLSGQFFQEVIRLSGN